VVQVARWPSSSRADGEAATLTQICCFLTPIGQCHYRRSSLPSHVLREGGDRETHTDGSREPAEPRAATPTPAKQRRHTPWLQIQVGSVVVREDGRDSGHGADQSVWQERKGGARKMKVTVREKNASSGGGFHFACWPEVDVFCISYIDDRMEMNTYQYSATRTSKMHMHADLNARLGQPKEGLVLVRVAHQSACDELGGCSDGHRQVSHYRQANLYQEAFSFDTAVCRVTSFLGPCMSLRYKKSNKIQVI
jgi:hypothetical protein